MQVTLLAPKYCLPTPLSLLAVHVDRLEDRGSSLKKPDYWLTAFSYFCVASGPSRYLLAHPAEPRDGRGVQY
jgi:hypothetical protein